MKDVKTKPDYRKLMLGIFEDQPKKKLLAKPPKVTSVDTYREKWLDPEGEI